MPTDPVVSSAVTVGLGWPETLTEQVADVSRETSTAPEVGLGWPES